MQQDDWKLPVLWILKNLMVVYQKYVIIFQKNQMGDALQIFIWSNLASIW